MRLMKWRALFISPYAAAGAEDLRVRAATAEARLEAAAREGRDSLIVPATSWMSFSTQALRVQNTFDDVASTIHQSLREGARAVARAQAEASEWRARAAARDRELESLR